MDDTLSVFSLSDVCRKTGLSLRTIKNAIAKYADTATSAKPDGLRAIKIGKRTFVRPRDLETYLDDRPEFTRRAARADVPQHKQEGVAA